MELTNISLFSGIGGMDLGAEAAGIETRAQVEINPFCREILSLRFPHAVQFGDIREVRGRR